MPGVLAMLMGHTQPSATDTVVAVKHTVLAVAWMAINQSVSMNILDILTKLTEYTVNS
jgi:hypothetical protein